MGKGANKQLLSNSGTAQGRSGNLSGKANSAYSFLEPQLESEATNPQGYSPTDLSAINTATQQSAGGSTAGTVGESNLEAARTRNSGGFAGVATEAGRSAERDLSQKALDVQTQNANLKEAQRQQALSSIQQLYGVDLQTALGYLNGSNSALNDENASHPLQSGFKTGADVIASLSGGYKAIKGK